MTTLRDIFDYDALQDAVQQGYIRVQTHPTEPLSILNYAEKAQYERMWTPEILASRGLIYNTNTLEIVARGFKKFFNFDDTSQPNPPVGPMIRSDKVDGSLGIAYLTETTGEPAIATRGSFTSDQALHATDRLRDYYFAQDDDLHAWIVSTLWDGFTPVFEIIYSTNRIVVNYGERDELVLLDVLDNATGASDLSRFDESPWPDRTDKTLISGGFYDTIASDIVSGREGFVLYWPARDFRCKVKSAEYVELHRLVTGLSKKSVWEMLSQGKTVADIKENVPDELFDWVDTTVGELNDAAAAMVDQIYEDFDSIIYDDPDLRDDRNRKRFAAQAMKFPVTRAYLFMVLDGKQPEDIWKAVWRTLKPVGDTRAWGRGEDVD